ncbi:S9 family peptidase [Sulfobacillus thermosulfidooxidans]|uniref:S9 family peptidase n=1 Tax=Sulfobacillus thermosulfidooxidans TaxID=28034 RepID=UPI00096BA837|nr:S9 family peptidase [Sulfobacillus thermosulfidooxidans]OLZ10578.1 hypothetical protein BFX05_01750 [Sulfobacillus thermosulfidooxidans]OLZ16815.1 hypothetical protein BFX06_14485 [Sulfobacillus thermosulfidooxidans]OLZ22255.1 hypothetical protein BFX07_10365 [Sulfobacillus thermosulfidooxidans]
MTLKAEDLLALKTWGQAVAAPDGRVFFVESQINKQTNAVEQRIMQTEPDGSSWTSVQPFTQGPSDTLPQISPDGHYLAFLSRRSGSNQVWIMPLKGGEARQLTQIKGGIKDFAWHPHGQKMVVIAHLFRGLIENEKSDDQTNSGSPSDEMLAYRFTRDVKIITKQYYKFDGSGFLGDFIDTAVSVDLPTNSVQVMTPGLEDVFNPVFSVDGETLFYLQRPKSSADVNPQIREIFSHAGPRSQQLTHLGLAISRLIVHPNGKTLVFTANDPEDLGYGNEKLWLYDLETAQARCLSDGLDRPVGDHTLTDVGGLPLDKPVVSRDGEWVLMSLSDHGRVNLWKFSLTGEELPRAITQNAWTVYSYAPHATGLIVVASDPLNPSIIQIMDEEGTYLSAPLNVPLPWAQEELAMPLAYQATSADGTKVDAWILLPSSPQKNIPVILQVHGGPMAMYGYRFMFEMQLLRSLGYAVIYGNPRGSLGYGHDFCRTIIGHWGDKDYADVMAILDDALQGPGKARCDQQKLGIIGGSYGGFMVNWAIAHTDRFRCAVSMRSVVNRFSAMGTSDLGWLRVAQYGTKPWWEDPEPYWQQSPLRYSSSIHTPLLIEHQMNDYRLPLEQGEQLYHALKYLGREVKMILYPNESHGMTRNGEPWHRVFRLHQITSWFAAYLQH